jgi:transposase
LGKVAHGKPNMNESNSNATQGRVKVSRPTYDEAFKRSAVEHYQRHGGTIQRTAQELGINYWTLRGWIQSQGAPQGLPAIRNLSEAETEITRLRAELARVTEQRDVLKWMLEVNSSWAALLSAGMNPVQSGIRPPSPALNPGR